MKTNYTKLFMLMLLATTFAFAQQTVLLDLGDEYTTKLTPGNWNNMTEGVYGTQVGDHSIADMINDAGANTGFSFAITDAFQYFGGYGTLTTANPTTGAASWCPETAARDYFFTQTSGDPEGQVTFSGLDDSKFYSFEIFASRKTTQNRNSQYTIAGATTEVISLNPGDATGEGNTSNTVISNAIHPSSGAITLNLINGVGNVSEYAYINSLKMTETTTASVKDEILANGGVKAYPNPVNNILNIEYILNKTGKVNLTVTDISGRIIHSENTSVNQAGTYSLKWYRQNVSAGIYFLRLMVGNTQITKKIILK